MARTAPSRRQALVAEEIAVLSSRLVTVMHAHMERAAAAHDLSAAEARALCEVAQRRGCSGAALAQSLGFDPSHITALADRLEARGLLERRSDPADRRVKVLTITERGEQVEHDLRELMLHQPPTTELTPADQNALREALRQALEAIEASARDANTDRPGSRSRPTMIGTAAR